MFKGASVIPQTLHKREKDSFYEKLKYPTLREMLHEKQKLTKSQINFLILTFWVAVHLQNLKIASMIGNSIPVIKNIILTAFENIPESENASTNSIGQEPKTAVSNRKTYKSFKKNSASLLIDSQKEIDDILKRLGKDKHIEIVKNLIYLNSDLIKIISKDETLKERRKSSLHYLKNPPQLFNFNARTEKFYSPDYSITERDILKDEEELSRLKTIFKKKCFYFNSFVLLIALSKGEETLAQIIACHYETCIQETIIHYSIQKGFIDFLKSLFYFNKIFIVKEDHLFDPALCAIDIKTITLKFLVKNIRRLCFSSQANNYVRRILKWKIQFNENYLNILLTYRFDSVVKENIFWLSEMIDKNALELVILNNNYEFLKSALSFNLIDQTFFKDETYINVILEFLHDGTKLLSVLNLLSYIEIKELNFQTNKLLLSSLEEILKHESEGNKLIICYNPILVLALTAEFCNKVGNAFPLLKRRCQETRKEIIELSSIIIKDMKEDSDFQTVFLEKDYKDRNSLEIIVDNELFELLLDDKIDFLLDTIWAGPNHVRCDGKMSDYSFLTYLLVSPNQVPGNSSSIPTIAKNNFSPQLDRNFPSQYRFRKFSISYAYTFDILFSLAFFLIFLFWVFYDFLYYFNDYDLDQLGEELKEERIRKNLRYYNKTYFLVTCFSFTIGFHLLMKVVYNTISKKKIKIDRWSIVDLLFVGANFVSYNFFRDLTAENFMISERKYTILLYMVLVIVVTWIRFFMLFLMNKYLSPMLNTLFRMIKDTLAFIFLAAAFLLISASIFTTLFMDKDPENFGELHLSFRTLFGAMMGEFEYQSIPDRELTFSILLSIHLIFCSILLMNYLIAILSAVYEIMKDYGEFSYKTCVFYYCQKYTIPLADEAYGELIFNAAPVSILSIIILPFVLFSKDVCEQVSSIVSQVIFWVQNAIFALIYFTYEVVILPLAYLKTFVNILRSPSQQKAKLLTLVLWLLFGIFVLAIYLGIDIYHLFTVYSKNMNIRRDTFVQAEEQKKREVIQIYNEVLLTIHELSQNSIIPSEQNTMSKTQQYFNQINSQNLIHKLPISSRKKPEVIKFTRIKHVVEYWKNLRKKIIQNQNTQEYRDEVAENVLAGNVVEVVNTVLDQKYIPRAKIKSLQHVDSMELYKQDIITPDEIELVKKFLSKFVIYSNEYEKDYIYLKLILDTLPKEINEENYPYVTLYNFPLIQEAIVKYQNHGIEALFRHYDRRNRLRNDQFKNLVYKMNEELRDNQAIHQKMIQEILVKLGGNPEERKEVNIKSLLVTPSKKNILNQPNKNAEMEQVKSEIKKDLLSESIFDSM